MDDALNSEGTATVGSTSGRSGRSIRVTALSLTLILLSALLPATPLAAHDLRPTAVFAQAGFGEHSTESYSLGVAWQWNWQRLTSLGTLTGFNEVAFGRWITHGVEARGSVWATQAGITPVLRMQPSSWGGNWFVEAGVGANMILPLYQSREKHFSTEFNFGDHAAVGRFFGSVHQHDLALRLEHFSNAGIDHPNPGENFFQLRYTHRL